MICSLHGDEEEDIQSPLEFEFILSDIGIAIVGFGVQLWKEREGVKVKDWICVATL